MGDPFHDSGNLPLERVQVPKGHLCACGVMAATLVLETSLERGVGSTPSTRTIYVGIV